MKMSGKDPSGEQSSAPTSGKPSSSSPKKTFEQLSASYKEISLRLGDTPENYDNASRELSKRAGRSEYLMHFFS